MTEIPEAVNRTDPRLPIPGAADRHQGIDALRFVLCFAVALLHTMARADIGVPPLWVVVAASACRGAVPFFFITSGYFARIPAGLSWKILSRPITRILPVYLIWMVVYYGLYIRAAGKVPHIGPRELMTGGVALHLWFLPALAVAMIAVPLLLIKTGRTMTWLACAALAGINLAFVGYRDMLHLPEISGTRAMIAPLLFLIGVELARKTPSLKLPIATFAVIAAWGLTLAEELLISSVSKTPVLSHASIATTYIFGLAIFLFAKALPELKLVTFLAGFGYISLGIYASHLIFVHFFSDLVGADTLGAASATAAAALVTATILCLMLNRFELTRRFVR